ncbi:MAG TPA: hypothetical protein VFB00_02540 [Terriglobales bacterium]|nr:hypothetical protein [Terriglobales bacterium]
MQDQEAPPAEEGETGGVGDAVAAATLPAGPDATNSTVEFTPRLWTTVIGLR